MIYDDWLVAHRLFQLRTSKPGSEAETLPQSPLRTGSSSVWADSPSTAGSSMATDALPVLSLASSPGALSGFGSLPQALVRLLVGCAASVAL